MDIDIDSLVPLPLSTSIVWKYFGFLSISGEIVDRNYVYCKRCKMRIKYSNNTSNLYKHFATHHSSDYEQLYALRKIRSGPELHELPAKRCKTVGGGGCGSGGVGNTDEIDINMNLLEAAHIKLDMVDPEPHYLTALPDNDSTKNSSHTDIPPFQSSSSARFLASSYSAANSLSQSYSRKAVPLNSVHLASHETPASVINTNAPSTHYNYQSHVISDSLNFSHCNGQRKSIKSPDGAYKAAQWPVYYQSNSSPSSGVILDVLGALATVRRYCEANSLDLTLLQQLEKQIAVSELHRLSQ